METVPPIINIGVQIAAGHPRLPHHQKRDPAEVEEEDDAVGLGPQNVDGLPRYAGLGSLRPLQFQRRNPQKLSDLPSPSPKTLTLQINKTIPKVSWHDAGHRYRSLKGQINDKHPVIHQHLPDGHQGLSAIVHL